MEGVVVDEDGTWYGYYHNEIEADRQCGVAEDKVIPRIGAARSHDHGLTWQSLGIVLEAPPRSYECDTTTTTLSAASATSACSAVVTRRTCTSSTPPTYATSGSRAWPSPGCLGRPRRPGRQDHGLAERQLGTRQRLPVANGAQPGSIPPRSRSFRRPIVARQRQVVDAFWGPSVHWNTHLQQYVMLLNRSKDDWFTPEGIYVSFAPALDDPELWTPPVRILKGGKWYPQVIGLDRGEGTDKVAGEWARFFMSGTSYAIAHFIK
jgi:hypothetical protein